MRGLPGEKKAPWCVGGWVWWGRGTMGSQVCHCYGFSRNSQQRNKGLGAGFRQEGSRRAFILQMRPQEPRKT